MSGAVAFARAHRARHLAELCELSRIPSISTSLFLGEPGVRVRQ
jgi:hypothetical protein